MDLLETVQSIVQKTVREGFTLTDLVIGTVSKVKPLQITEKNVSDPIPAQALLLTASVVEKKIPVLKHSHMVSSGSCGDALSSVVCYENGKSLPVEDGYIILNRGLADKDKVLMLRVCGGQRYIVLSRIFEGA